MPTQKAEVSIKGITPLLMCAYPAVQIEGMNKRQVKEQAEYVAYRTPKEKQFYVPSANVQRALISGATYCKGKGRGSLQKVVAACVFVTPADLILDNQTPEIDSRTVVNHNVGKGVRVMAHRYRFDSWALSFFVEWDDVLLSEEQIRRVVDETFNRCGIMAFRPECKGSFGRAVVTLWKV